MDRDIGCHTTKAILEHLAAHEHLPTLKRLRRMDPYLSEMVDPLAYLQDTVNWVSADVVKRLFHYAVHVLEDSRAPYHMAGRAVRRSSFDYLQRLLFDTLGSTEAALRGLRQIPFLLDRTRQVEVVEVGSDSALLQIHWTPQMNLSRHFCLFCQGIFVHLPRYWRESPVALTETGCHFHGACFCEYRMQWQPKPLWRRWFSAPRFHGRLLRRIQREVETDRRCRRRQHDDTHHLNRELQLKMRQLTAIHETGKAILSVLDLKQLLSSIMRILASVGHVQRAAILWVNDTENTLDHLFAVGFSKKIHGILRDYQLPLGQEKNLLARVVRRGRSVHIPASESPLFEDAQTALPASLSFSLFAVPLKTPNRVIGVLATEAQGPNGISAETMETLELFAPQIAIAIRNATLYQQQQQQLVELKQSRALLCRAEKLSFLGNFSARLAHEIKNPLTAIGTFLQMLPSRLDDPEFRDDFYGIALEETGRINRLLAELLNLVKPVDPLYQNTDLHDLLDRMLLLVSPQSRGKNIELRRDFDPSIHIVNTDPEKLKQVVLNVLTNAVEFSPSNGEVRIRTYRRPGRSTDSEVCIEIIDSGSGVAVEDAENIFDPYYTTKTKSRKNGGTGLGLFIASQNMEDIGGSLRLGPAISDAGAVFIIGFPERRHPEPGSARAGAIRISG